LASEENIPTHQVLNLSHELAQNGLSSSHISEFVQGWNELDIHCDATIIRLPWMALILPMFADPEGRNRCPRPQECLGASMISEGALQDSHRTCFHFRSRCNYNSDTKAIALPVRRG
jgi:hypothetical protein